MEKLVKPSRFDLTKVECSLRGWEPCFNEYPEQTKIYCYTVPKGQDYQNQEAGRAKLGFLGRCTVTSDITLESGAFWFCSVYTFGRPQPKRRGDENLQNINSYEMMVQEMYQMVLPLPILPRQFEFWTKISAPQYTLSSLFFLMSKEEY